MEAIERWQPLRARERPIRRAGSIEERNCGGPGGYDPEVEKSAKGERNGGTPGATRCGAQCRACRRRARLGIGSLGTTSFSSPPVDATTTPPNSFAEQDRRRVSSSRRARAPASSAVGVSHATYVLLSEPRGVRTGLGETSGAFIANQSARARGPACPIEAGI